MTTIGAEVVGVGLVVGAAAVRQVHLLAQAVPSHDVWSVADRYGLPVAMLVALVLFLYKVLWPTMVKEWEAYREMMKAQLAESRADTKAQAAAMKAQGDAFLVALQHRDEMMREEFARLHDRLDRDRDK